MADSRMQLQDPGILKCQYKLYNPITISSNPTNPTKIPVDCNGITPEYSLTIFRQQKKMIYLLLIRLLFNEMKL